MTALAHPDIPGVTIGGTEDGVQLAIKTPDGEGIVTTLTPEGARLLADLLDVLAGAGWTTAATARPPSSEAATVASAATSPESQAS